MFHFVGHGFVRDGDGYLALIDSRGRMAEIGAQDMGIMLRDHGILLAVLNGCATGSTETEDLAGGVGQTLVSQGVRQWSRRRARSWTTRHCASPASSTAR